MGFVTMTTMMFANSVNKNNLLLWELINSSRARENKPFVPTSVMIYHRGASLSEQHTDLPIGHCTKQDLSRTSRYADKSSPEIARYHIPMPTARAATLSVATYA